VSPSLRAADALEHRHRETAGGAIPIPPRWRPQWGAGNLERSPPSTKRGQLREPRFGGSEFGSRACGEPRGGWRILCRVQGSSCPCAQTMAASRIRRSPRLCSNG